MSDSDPISPSRSQFAVWHRPDLLLAAGGMLMLLSYPLSAGPVIWMFHRSYIPPWSMGILMVVYGPLEYGCDQVPLLDATLGEYIRWWRDLP